MTRSRPSGTFESSENGRVLLRVALLGGSFNPPTKQHALIACELLRIQVVDEVWFVPCANHPFQFFQKSKDKMLSFTARCWMLQKTVEAMPEEYQSNIRVCEVEEKHKLSGYTVDTIKKLMELHPDRSFFWVVGTDCVNDFPRWKKINWIKEHITLIIYPREGYKLQMESHGIMELTAEHIVLTSKDVIISDSSSTAARNDPDSGLLVPEVASFWKGYRHR